MSNTTTPVPGLLALYSLEADSPIGERLAACFAVDERELVEAEFVNLTRQGRLMNIRELTGELAARASVLNDHMLDAMFAHNPILGFEHTRAGVRYLELRSELRDLLLGGTITAG